MTPQRFNRDVRCGRFREQLPHRSANSEVITGVLEGSEQQATGTWNRLSYQSI